MTDAELYTLSGDSLFVPGRGTVLIATLNRAAGHHEVGSLAGKKLSFQGKVYEVTGVEMFATPRFPVGTRIGLQVKVVAQ